MSKPLIVITGKDGQLGYELLQLSVNYQDVFDFLFTGREIFNLSLPENIPSFFEKYKPSYFINCAAYTAVDKAETEKNIALAVNGTTVGIIANCCEKYRCKLITISTDYVFDGNGKVPYKPNAPTNPVNFYGQTKLMGEQLAQQNNPSSIVLRTSWVYSVHGNNFVKTMLRLMKERTELKVVSDQIGCPTYAADFAEAIIHIIDQDRLGKKHQGIYHYSNKGIISWFDFASAILRLADLPTKLYPIPTTEFPTPAKRPNYSVLDTSSFQTDFQINLIDWEISLIKFFQKLHF